MKHPEPEQWVPYLYGEAGPELRQELKAHLEVCASCREEFSRWQRSSRRLDTWKLRRGQESRERFAPALKWAAAAMLMLGLGLGLGFGAGRVSAGKSDVARLRAALEPQLRQELTQTLQNELSRSREGTLAAARAETEKSLAAYDTTLETRRAADNEAIRLALAQLQLQNVSLKKELDTVALNTDAGLEHTEQQLAQLAVYRPPGNNSESQK